MPRGLLRKGSKVSEVAVKSRGRFGNSCLLVSATYVYGGINNGSKTSNDAQDMAVLNFFSNIMAKFFSSVKIQSD